MNAADDRRTCDSKDANVTYSDVRIKMFTGSPYRSANA